MSKPKAMAKNPQLRSLSNMEAPDTRGSAFVCNQDHHQHKQLLKGTEIKDLSQVKTPSIRTFNCAQNTEEKGTGSGACLSAIGAKPITQAVREASSMLFSMGGDYKTFLLPFRVMS